jgi:hypothetical protein
MRNSEKNKNQKKNWKVEKPLTKISMNSSQDENLTYPLPTPWQTVSRFQKRFKKYPLQLASSGDNFSSLDLSLRSHFDTNQGLNRHRISFTCIEDLEISFEVVCVTFFR